MKQSKTIICPSSLKKIGHDAFEDYSRLKNIELNEGLEEIKPSAFSRCYNLREIKCPRTLKKIGSKAFWHCRRLEEVIINDGLDMIGSGAFMYCPSLYVFSVPSHQINCGSIFESFKSTNERNIILQVRGKKISRDILASFCNQEDIRDHFMREMTARKIHSSLKEIQFQDRKYNLTFETKYDDIVQQLGDRIIEDRER